MKITSQEGHYEKIQSLKVKSEKGGKLHCLEYCSRDFNKFQILFEVFCNEVGESASKNIKDTVDDCPNNLMENSYICLHNGDDERGLSLSQYL